MADGGCNWPIGLASAPEGILIESHDERELENSCLAVSLPVTLFLKDPTCWRYELVEIPKALLQEAEEGELEIYRKTKQETRPGYCRVTNTDGELKFELYFDAGSERKLQIRHLSKDLCTVHAQWEFATA